MSMGPFKYQVVTLLLQHGVAHFDKVPSGYPGAGCHRYKKFVPRPGQQPSDPGPIPFVAFTVADNGAECSFSEGGNRTVKYASSVQQVESFLREHGALKK